MLIKQRYFKKFMKNIFDMGAAEIFVLKNVYGDYKIKITTPYCVKNAKDMIIGEQKIIKGLYYIK